MDREEEEQRTKAMLLGYDWFRPNLLRKRIGPNQFAGMADFEYMRLDTMQVIARQSELDLPTEQVAGRTRIPTGD